MPHRVVAALSDRRDPPVSAPSAERPLVARRSYDCHKPAPDRPGGADARGPPSHRIRQAEALVATGHRVADDDLIFTDATGDRLWG